MDEEHAAPSMTILVCCKELAVFAYSRMHVSILAQACDVMSKIKILALVTFQLNKNSRWVVYGADAYQ